MAVSFCLGAVMLATTAFADITSKTGYDQFKNSIKYTAESLSKGLNSYTMDVSMTMKDNDKLLMSEIAVEKYEQGKHSSENTSTSANRKEQKNFSYRDTQTGIWYSPDNDTYQVTEYTSPRKANTFDNPFEEERAKDVEKIFDAMVGNLKDYVVVEDKPDGSKVLSGSLSEAQIPALVNAVSSFAFKQEFSGRSMRSEDAPLPTMVNDIFIKNVTGKANISKEGLIESVLASGVLTGKDKDGNPHDVTVEMLFRLRDVNKTVVTKPDLTGKKVEKRTEDAPIQEFVTKKFVGQYKNDIVMIKDDSFIKIGERTLEIIAVDDKHVTGRYSEQYSKEYADKNSSKNITFDASLEKNANHAEFDYVNESGNKEKGSISFDTYSGKVYFNIRNSAKYDSVFNRVFDK